MALFLTRRTYNASTQKFNNNFAALTRPVWLPEGGGGGIISLADWLAQVRARAQNGQVVVFVHGFNTDQAEMLERLRRVEAGLAANGYAGAVVGFDWPSAGIVTAYDPDVTAAKKSAPFLVRECIWPLLGQGLRVHVVAHSMGAYLTLRGMSGEGDTDPANPWRIGEVMFVSADVEAEALRSGAWGALVMEQRSTRFTNCYNVADRTLSLAGGLIHGGRPRVGQVGLPDQKPANSVDLYTTAQFRAQVPQQKQEDIIFSHIWYYEDAGALRDMALTMSGTADAAMPTRRNTDVGDRALLT